MGNPAGVKAKKREKRRKKYEQRLVVIGVHTPEFPFEHDVDNVRRAVRAMKIEYPIAVDDDYAIWRAFDNQYWPALYFLDARGRVRHHKFGEGDYAQSEKIIQQLLAEAGRAASKDLVKINAQGAEAAADMSDVASPETYVGYLRAENFASPGGEAADKRQVYQIAPAPLQLNQWALAGDWTVEGEKAVLNAPNGRIAYSFHARDLHLVLGPGADVVDAALGGTLAAFMTEAGFEAKRGDALAVPTSGKLGAKAAVLVGMGDRDTLDVSLAHAMRDFLAPKRVAVYRLVGDQGEERWLTRAALLADSPAATADPAWVDLAYGAPLRTKAGRLVRLGDLDDTRLFQPRINARTCAALAAASASRS